MNTLTEMMTLSFARPASGASKTEFAAWFEAKARLHEHLAALGGPDAEFERALARKAHRRSSDLVAVAA
ncbi:hypothetical protein [Smaragdicoccus niigatensis]|uniref:hypothetical protein n=1 Tax=Smaragdicoccus niigatensis TaxID=359359 RepID=UPI0003814950|nr:hypothetical protein [Smaragdicoccus niigatensis]